MSLLENYQGLATPLFVETSETQPVHLLVGRNGTHIRLSANAYALLQHYAAGGNVATYADLLYRKTGQHTEPAKIEAAYQHIVERIVAIEAKAERQWSGFWLRQQLLPATLVTRLADVSAWLYQPWLAIPCAILFALLWLGYAVLIQQIPSLAATAYSLRDWLLAYFLFLLSAFAHELGHAAACRYYGVAPGSIGFTFYLIYPAFYSDVSAAWRLTRWQRVVVDCGGAYFQSLVALLCGLFYWLFAQPAFAAALFLIGASLLFSLNPVFKFDGYWIVADALGVTNLAKQPLRILRYIVAEMRGQPTDPLPWSPGVLAILAFYAWLSVAVWGYFLWQLCTNALRYFA